MKILYATQATGNGHISRANAFIPILKRHCEVDVLVSGTAANIQLHEKPKYQCKGISFTFGKNGGIDYLDTFKKLNSRKFLADVKTIPIEDYDLVLNDFEPVTAWACRRKGIQCLALSHQYAVLNKMAPKPEKSDLLAAFILKFYAPVEIGIGFHFKSYDQNIYNPIIRPAIREANVYSLGHYTVYLPAYSDEKVMKTLKPIKDVVWHVFSKTAKTARWDKQFFVQPIAEAAFTESFVTSAGIITGGGFETPAEALFMGKKMISIPMKKQFEQQCNTAALQEMGVTVLKSLHSKHVDKIEEWIWRSKAIQISYTDDRESLVKDIVAVFSLKTSQSLAIAY